MNRDEYIALVEELKTAWKQFLEVADGQTIEFTRQTLQEHNSVIKQQRMANILNGEAHTISEFSMVWSILNDTLEDDLVSFFETDINTITNMLHNQLNVSDGPPVSPSGDIYGSGKYEQFDLGWIKAVIQWLLNHNDRYPFGTNPAWVAIPDTARVAIFGDWGGGNWKNNTVADTIAQNISKSGADVVIHLGDVYYAGLAEEEQDNLLELWPQNIEHNFTLNSNHEMYPGGKGYFGTTLADKIFAAQQGTSYFALENTNWIIVGLDSAYAAPFHDAYMKGGLNEEQTGFLHGVKKMADSEGKKVIVLTHHNPLSTSGKSFVPKAWGQKENFWNAITSCLGSCLKYWYWGHVHGGAVYSLKEGVSCRLCGHGDIPWGKASIYKQPYVEWHESHSANDPNNKVRVQNGYAILNFEGSEINESFYGEDGEVHWPS